MLFLVALSNYGVVGTSELLTEMMVAAVGCQLFPWILGVLARIKLYRLLKVIVLVELTLIQQRNLRLDARKLREIMNLTLIYITCIFLNLVQVEIHDFIWVVRGRRFEQLICVQKSWLSQIPVFHINVANNELGLVLLRHFKLLSDIFGPPHCLLLLFEQLILLELFQALLGKIPHVLGIQMWLAACWSKWQLRLHLLKRLVLNAAEVAIDVVLPWSNRF